MEGGIKAWQGLVATGAPEAGMAYFKGTENPEELIALAWSLEEGTRRFYSDLAKTLPDEEAARLFRNLTIAEEHHKASLLSVLRDITNREPQADFPGALFAGEVGEIMEGGVSVSKAIEWTRGKPASDALDLSVSLETNAYDLYLKMMAAMGDERAVKVFRVLADEEKAHLNRLSALLEKRLSA